MMAESEENQEQQGIEASGGQEAGGVAEDQDKLQCSVEVSESGLWKKKVAIAIPRSEIDKELDKQYGELRHTAEIPGFRKGRAPRRLMEKRFGTDVSKQTKYRLLAEAFEQLESKEDFEVLGEPDFDPEKIEMPETGDFTLEYEVEVKPEFELPKLEGVRVEKHLCPVTKERIEQELETLRNRAGRTEDITEEAAQENDFIRADVTMKVEGAEETETFDDHPLRVGEGGINGIWIDKLGEILTGAAVGDTKTCEAEVPDSHAKEDYRGKQAQFSIEVRHIRRHIPAELNEEFLGSLGISDEAELKQRIEENLENQADREVRQGMVGQIYEYLEKGVEFELPADAAARHADRYLARRYYKLLQDGVPREQIDANMEQLRASTSGESARQYKMSFIMERAAKELEVEVSEGEVNAFVAQVAAAYRRRPEKLREELQREGRLEQIKEQIRDEKAVDRILEMAEVVDAPAAAPPAGEKKKKARKRSTKQVERKAPKADK